MIGSVKAIPNITPCLVSEQLTISIQYVISISGLHHDDEKLIVHAGGASLDRLVLRNIRNLTPRPAPESASIGFTLQLDSEIVQLELFGTSSWNTADDILAVTSSELYHLKTSRVGEELGRAYAPAHGSLDGQDVALEPVQKWVPNFQLVCAAGSRCGWSRGYLLSAQQELFSVSCERGVQSHCGTDTSTSPAAGTGGTRGAKRRTGVSIFDGEEHWQAAPHSVEHLRVESTAHAQVCLLSRGCVVFRKDLRERGSATALFQSGCSPISALHSVVTWRAPAASSCSDLFLVGVQGALLLMDPRLPSRAVAQRGVSGGAHSLLRGAHSPEALLHMACDMEDRSGG